jgi:DNA modification methylase
VQSLLGIRVEPGGLAGPLLSWLSRTASSLLDPFCGSGTTGVATRLPGRSYLGFKIDHEQLLAANERLAGIPGD